MSCKMVLNLTNDFTTGGASQTEQFKVTGKIINSYEIVFAIQVEQIGIPT